MINNYKWYRKLRGGVWYKHIKNTFIKNERLTLSISLPYITVYSVYYCNKNPKNSIKTENYEK